MRHVQTDPSCLDVRWNQTNHRNDIRRQWERLLNRARFLEPQERLFLELVVEQDSRISRLAQMTRRSPASLRRQIHDITRRLDGPELRAILAYPDAFTPFEKVCLREHLIRKHSLFCVANNLNTTVYTLRKTLSAARTKAQRLCGKQSCG